FLTAQVTQPDSNRLRDDREGGQELLADRGSALQQVEVKPDKAVEALHLKEQRTAVREDGALERRLRDGLGALRDHTTEDGCAGGNAGPGVPAEQARDDEADESQVGYLLAEAYDAEAETA
ncbi:unnamed protein product, partial [Polarella glacialis]